VVNHQRLRGIENVIEYGNYTPGQMLHEELFGKEIKVFVLIVAKNVLKIATKLEILDFQSGTWTTSNR